MAQASAVVDRVRTLLSDTFEPFRWTDSELLRHSTDGQRLIIREKPSASIEITVIKAQPPDLTSLGDLLRIDDQLIQVLANYVCHRALLDDTDDGSANLAENHKLLFLEQMNIKSI